MKRNLIRTALLIIFSVAMFFVLSRQSEKHAPKSIHDSEPQAAYFFDIRNVCRKSSTAVLAALGIERQLFDVKITTSEYGTDQWWDLHDAAMLERHGLTALRLEFSNEKLRALSFNPQQRPMHPMAENFEKNIRRVGLVSSDIKRAPMSYRVNAQTLSDGVEINYVIEIDVAGTLFQCFEYHAGH